MPVAQTDYTKKREKNTQQSVLLIIDVPGIDAERVEDLTEKLSTFAQQWIKEQMTQRMISGAQYESSVHVCDTNKLRIFESMRG